MTDTPADAVVREVWEETGLIVEPTRILGVYGGPAFVGCYPNGDEAQYISTMFECDVVGGELHGDGDDGDEIRSARFWSRDDALRLPVGPWLVDVLPRLYERGPTWFVPTSWRPS